MEKLSSSVQRYAGFKGMRQNLSSIQFRDMLVLKGWTETFKYSVQRYAGFKGMRQNLSSIQFRDMLVLKG